MEGPDLGFAVRMSRILLAGGFVVM